VGIFDEIQESVAHCFTAAVKARQLRPATNCDELASFLYSSLQGAILQAKAERNAADSNGPDGRRVKKVRLEIVNMRSGEDLTGL
jgi:Tetracyclin repressor-like, C-terminal domain